MEYIAFDSHKHYTFVSVERQDGTRVVEQRVDHAPGSLREFLREREPGSPVAVETIGTWYWIVQEIEQAGMVPKLVHARRAKMMLASSTKTDRLDARGMNRLARSGTLPTVWIPPGELRDRRELYRTRMVLSQQKTRLKNRIHATLAKYGLRVEGTRDTFALKSHDELLECVQALPEQTRFATELLLEQLQSTTQLLGRLEKRMLSLFRHSEEASLLMSIPGIGPILSVVIAHEVGDVRRFPSPGHLASYAGTTPSVHASGGKIRIGQLRSDVNHYLKWAFIEAANVIGTHRRRWTNRYVIRLYERVRSRRGHQTAAGAIGHHLAEATYWVLTRREVYREPH